MAATEPTRAQLSAEDGHRLARLSEEVRGRLLEIALITTRSLGIQATQQLVKFVPTGAQVNEDPGPGDWMEIIDVDGYEVCYGCIDGQSFTRSPCG